MAIINQAELLNDSKVKAEIDRYKWIESEKAGYDIGFERASREWISRNAESLLKKNSKKKASSKAK